MYAKLFFSFIKLSKHLFKLYFIHTSIFFTFQNNKEKPNKADTVIFFCLPYKAYAMLKTYFFCQFIFYYMLKIQKILSFLYLTKFIAIERLFLIKQHYKTY